MGERAQAGHLIYTVLDTRWAISLGQPPTPRIPTNRYLLINLVIINGGANPFDVPTFSLVDDAGQVYQELESGEGVPNWIGFVRRVSPADSLQGIIAFDVPQKEFKLRVAGEEDSAAMVKIPLSIGEPPADLAPGQAK
jgi:hypothetical protein